MYSLVIFEPDVDRGQSNERANIRKTCGSATNTSAGANRISDVQ